jgi:hypothetical protein
MGRLLGSFLPALLLLAVLGACGNDDSGGAAQDPAPTSATNGSTSGDSGTGDGSSDGSVEFELVDTITVTAAGGQLSETAVPLSDEADVQAFVEQFASGDMGAQVQDAVAQTDVPDGQVMYAAVVAIGCDSPDQVAVSTSETGLVITALKVPSPLPECLAPMTTVALVLVPASEVG